MRHRRIYVHTFVSEAESDFAALFTVSFGTDTCSCEERALWRGIWTDSAVDTILSEATSDLSEAVHRTQRVRRVRQSLGWSEGLAKRLFPNTAAAATRREILFLAASRGTS